ncbi:MAG TPA: hypothetical protein VGE55_02965 [Limnobacter sp.]|uniref:hypothetical protein n=1 Tax=Limnobacter sp. TaxID=2003368 RepID=UPI002ED7FAF4
MFNDQLFLAGILASITPLATAANNIQWVDGPALVIGNTSNLTTNADAPTTLEAFVRNWSQFEILVPKNQFPIAAPNCKQTVQIRFKGIEPTTADINAVQQARWNLLQAIRTEDASLFPITLKVDTSAYIAKGNNGQYALRYCNVFVE